MSGALWEYRAEWLNVVDGDTIDARVDLGFDVNGVKVRLRLAGIDTPEKSDRIAWDKARAFTIGWLNQLADDRGRVFIRTERDPHGVDKDDSFGRYIATVYNLVDGERQGDHCLNADLLLDGHATPYTR